MIAANHINWTRDVHDPQDAYDSDTNRVDARGDISFDTKIFLTSDVSTNTTIFLKMRGGSLFLRSAPALVDLGNVKLSSPGKNACTSAIEHPLRLRKNHLRHSKRCVGSNILREVEG